jgi:hypothetical protein
MNIALKLALAAAGMAAFTTPSLSVSNERGIPGQPPVLRTLILAQAETKPFQPVPAKPALDQAPALYGDLGVLHFRAGTRMPRAQAYFDQGIRLAFAFNHAEAQRAFGAAQRSGVRDVLLGRGAGARPANKRAIEVDERYFRGSPSDPMYRYACHPHNIHFLMVSAQLGGDGRTAVDAATRLDAALPVEAVKQFAVIQPVKAAPYFTHLTFSNPETVLALAAPEKDLVLVNAMYHYARAVAHAARKDAASAASVWLVASMRSR